MVDILGVKICTKSVYDVDNSIPPEFDEDVMESSIPVNMIMALISQNISRVVFQRCDNPNCLDCYPEDSSSSASTGDAHSDVGSVIGSYADMMARQTPGPITRPRSDIPEERRQAPPLPTNLSASSSVRSRQVDSSFNNSL